MPLSIGVTPIVALENGLMNLPISPVNIAASRSTSNAVVFDRRLNVAII